jgi:hypothetical protein
VRCNTHFVTSVTRVNLTHFVGVPTSNTYCIQKGQLGAEVSRCIYIWSSTLSTLVPAICKCMSDSNCIYRNMLPRMLRRWSSPSFVKLSMPPDMTTPRTKSVRQVRTMRTEHSSSEFRSKKGTESRKSELERNFLLSLEKNLQELCPFWPRSAVLGR